MSLRRITSLIMLFSFIFMSFTGIVLFFVPWGRIANWINWKFLGLTKVQYEELHVSFMVLFLIFGFIHIYLNWKPILNYLKDRRGRITFTRWEFIVSLVVTIIFFFGSIYAFQPFKSYFNFEVNLKSRWAKNIKAMPPYGHAEESSLKVLCERTSIDLSKALAVLRENNIKVKSANESLRDIALQNGITPMDVYALIKPLSVKNYSSFQGVGRKTLKELSLEGVVDFKVAKKYLAARGIEVKPNDTLKSISTKLNLTPKELLTNLKKMSK